MLLLVSTKCIKSPWNFSLSLAFFFILGNFSLLRLSILGMSAIMSNVNLAGPQQGQ